MKTASKNKKRKNHNRVLFNAGVIAESIATAYLDDLDALESRIAHDVCDPVVSRYFIKSARAAILKKFTLEKSLGLGKNMPARDVRALKKFFDTNSYVALHNGLLSFPPLNVHPSHLTHEQRVLLRARNFIHYVLGDLDVNEWFDKCKNSSGTTLGLKFSETNVENKLKLPLTVTERCRPLMDVYFKYDSQLCDSIFRTLEATAETFNMYSIVEGSRLTSVPKTDEISRIINIEPTCNMFLQLGLMELMYEKLLDLGVDITRLQNDHKFKAWMASITATLATIDFSSASDSVAIALVQWLFPALWWEAISATRSPFAFLGNMKIDLQMVGTMGNGTTFPLETLVFLALAVAVQSDEHSYSTLPDLTKLETCSVYGDDCILPTEYAESFCNISYRYGFMVNMEKSFIDPQMRFRESCGGDFYHGRNIRPYHLRAPQNSGPRAIEAWLYTIINQCLKKYMLYFGNDRYVYISALWTTLFGLFRDAQFEIKIVPNDFPEDSGIQFYPDIGRLLRLYSDGCRFSRVYIDKHGSVSKFNYLTFRYEDKPELVYEGYHYWMWLKQHQITVDKILYSRRRRLANGRTVTIHGDIRPDAVPRKYIDKGTGGYVVSKGSYPFSYFLNDSSTAIVKTM